MVLLLYGSLRYYFISKSTVETVLLRSGKRLPDSDFVMYVLTIRFDSQSRQTHGKAS